MAQEKLPWELEEEILFRVPPLSLARFRIVCKRWNTLSKDKIFINNHLARARPLFILATKSKFYSVLIVNLNDDDPKIEVRELTLDIPGLESQTIPSTIHHCDGLLLCSWKDDNVTTVWNPLLRQSRLIEPYSKQNSVGINGLGYDNSGYKIVASQLINSQTEWIFYNFASNDWKKKDYDFKSDGIDISWLVIVRNTISLNEILYRVASSPRHNKNKFFIVSMDCSRERMKVFCHLPCKKNSLLDAPILAIFMGDRFSVFRKCKETKKIEIWVTKNKISSGDGEDVVWINFMTVPIFPDLVDMTFSSRPRYFIDDKTLIICSCDKVDKLGSMFSREIS